MGTVNIITGFTVQAYKASDKFRVVHGPVQLIFSKDTKIQQVDDKGTNIPTEIFDFYDYSQVKDHADRTDFLIGLEFSNKVTKKSTI